MRGVSPRMKVVTPGSRPSRQLHAGGCVGGYLILCRPTFCPPTADSEAMSSAATVETFSIMSTHGRALKCSARGFAETCAETRPEELRCTVEKTGEQIPNVEVSRLIERIVIKSANREHVCSFLTLVFLQKLDTSNEFKQVSMGNIRNKVL